MIREYFNTGWEVQSVTGVFNINPPKGKAVVLPHDAQVDKQRTPEAPNGSKNGYYPSGSCEYVNRFEVPEEYRNKRVTFEFEGAYNNATVYLNGQFAGQCPYGYSNFYVKADAFLKYGKKNEIKVITRNNDDSRWYAGLGLYRNVKIMVADLIHIAVDGVKIDTELMDADLAKVTVNIHLQNESLSAEKVRLQVAVLDAEGETVAENSLVVSPAHGENLQGSVPLYVNDPKLWSAEEPYLYQCRVCACVNGQEVDREEMNFGIRTLALDPFHGLRINGKTVKLYGACIHHDNGVLGAATIERAEERRVQILKAAGFNAIRCAHNPASKALLAACDKYGMYVMDEAFDMWTEQKSVYDYSIHFPEWWERDVESMVQKDYNHPSVIMYSIGNEIPDIRNMGGNRWGRNIAQKIKTMDPHRYTINSLNGFLAIMDLLSDASGELNSMMNEGENPMARLRNGNEMGEILEEPCDAVDIAGYNYMLERIERDHNANPNWVFCGSETCSKDIAANWKRVMELDYLIGDFCWTGWDYLGEAGIGKVTYGGKQERPSLYSPYPWFVADCGDIDILGNRRPISYYKEIVVGLRKEPYIAVYRPEHYGEEPNLTQWSWSDTLSSWSFRDHVGKPIRVEVYADAEEVELLVNGNSYGRARVGTRMACIADFDITYEPGEIRAIAYNGGTVSGETDLHSAGEEVLLQVTADRTEIRADTTDLAYLDITLADEAGNLCSDRDCSVAVEVQGAGILQGLGSRNPCTEEGVTGNRHMTFDGRALAVIRPMEAGEIVVTVSAEGMESKTVKIIAK